VPSTTRNDVENGLFVCCFGVRLVSPREYAIFRMSVRYPA